MPWCEDCAKFWNPNSMPASGECPTCGVRLAEPHDSEEPDEYRAPWHFKLLVVLAAIYLLWRIVQLVTWVV
jgi:hypothetical protein